MRCEGLNHYNDWRHIRRNKKLNIATGKAKLVNNND